jgi:hypothetical protein
MEREGYPGHGGLLTGPFYRGSCPHGVMLQELRIGRIQTFMDTWTAAFITLNGRQMIMFEV